MADGFLETLSTPSVKAAQAANGSREAWAVFDHEHESDSLTAAEAGFIAARDSFYLASISESGWPYIQHRGGPPGFLKVLDERTLGFADFRGNRQYITLGNVMADDRVALFLMDYPHRARLKILAHMSVHDLAAEPELAERLATPGYKGRPERGFILRVEGFNWNCPQHITPRFTAAEIGDLVAPLQARIAALEAENRRLVDRLQEGAPAAARDWAGDLSATQARRRAFGLGRRRAAASFSMLLT